MPYIDAADVEAYLGRALTTAEAAQVDDCIAAADAVIDRYTGRTWVGTTVVELHTYVGRPLRLSRLPVSAMTQVRVRPAYLGGAWSALVAADTYELADATSGLLYVSTSYGYTVEATYTVSAALPAPVKLAAEMLSAGWLTAAQASSGQLQGIKRYSIGGELSVEYADAAAAISTLPAAVRSVLDTYRRSVAFA